MELGGEVSAGGEAADGDGVGVDPQIVQDAALGPSAASGAGDRSYMAFLIELQTKVREHCTITTEKAPTWDFFQLKVLSYLRH